VLVDIGGGGIRVQSLAPLKRGAEVPVRLEIPDKYEAIQCSGIVVWSKPNGAAGIRFTSISESQKTNLRSWLEDLEKAATSPSDSQQYDEFTSVVSKIRASQLNNADALNFILRRVSEITTASGAAIALGTPENMVCLAAVGIAAEVGSQVPPGKGLTSEAVLRRKMVHCQNTKNDPRVGANASFGSAAILPLVVGGEVRGTLEAFSPRTYAFDTTAIDNLEKLADAVVFVTYGIVTQRRLLAAKTPGSAPPSTISTTSTVTNSAPARPASVAPVRPQQTIAPSVPLAAASASTSSFATPMASAAPATAPVAPPRPALTQPKHAPTPRSHDSHLHLPRVNESEPPRTQPPRKSPVITYAEPSREGSSTKWIVLALVLLVGGTSGWYFLLRPKTQTNAANSSAETVNAPATQAAEIHSAEPQQVVPAPVESAGTSLPITTKELKTPVLATTSAKETSAKSEKLPEKKVAETPAKPEKTAPETPKSSPIVLSASTGHPPVQGISKDPIAAPLPIGVTGSMANVALPSTTSTAPKLAASAVSQRSGGNLLKRVSPMYPQRARSMGLQGVVELRVRVGKDGNIADVRRTSGNAILGDAAIEAVRKWHYEPMLLNGQPTEFETNVSLKFDLAK
jgi:TonB family protein